ncbi:MAG TPA: DUF4143 domain-containing protein [Longimicrobiales bacterium]|nr:DUF4143 domain-containing protein [Longimicrobiales bacterium]
MRRYLDALTSALVVRQLRPWHENLRKRQVKTPKVYVADTGVLHTLLGLDAAEDLRLDRIDVLHAGRETFPMAERIRAVATHRIWTDVEPL